MRRDPPVRAGGYGAILLVSAIDLLCAALTAGIGLFVVLTGTTAATASVSSAAGGIGAGGAFVHVYGVTPPEDIPNNAPIHCGQFKDAHPHERGAGNWEQSLASPPALLTVWTFAERAPGRKLVCTALHGIGVTARLEVLSPAGGGILKYDISCANLEGDNETAQTDTFDVDLEDGTVSASGCAVQRDVAAPPAQASILAPLDAALASGSLA